MRTKEKVFFINFIPERNQENYAAHQQGERQADLKGPRQEDSQLARTSL